VYNHSEVIRNYFTNVYCYVKTSKSVEDQYFVPSKGKLNHYHLHSHNSYVERDPTTNWAVFKNAKHKYYLGCVQYPSNTKQRLKPEATNLEVFNMGARHEKVAIKPKETMKYEILYVLADNIEQIAPLEHLQINDFERV